MAFLRFLTYDPVRDPSKMKVRVPQKTFPTKIVKGLLAELIGTLFLVFFCGGSVTAAFYFPDGDPAARILLIATIQGFALAAIIYAISGVSGCNLNPAITVANLLSGRTGFINALAYIIGQVIGCIAGAGILYACIEWRYQMRLGNTRLGDGIPAGNGFLMELFTTCLLCLVVLGTSVFNVWDRRLNRIAPFAIGMTLFAGVAVANPFTGGSLNPVRTLGPSIISGTWANAWIYWAGPLIGGVLAAFIFRVLLQERFDVIDKPGYVPFDFTSFKGDMQTY
ncbi:aquaporin [Cavenderia fasciculata]|uniref:Aquaporin n=1 Tax=Cavenderia fasciculata TaxID=261658 RepID=F4PS60_CACFS|nr:aquaporin [Cavenderia fasciculata]EGG21443.1 aquaporin [Cavenderia fasciculata]|eukprot:XP_004359293.1 aquaporin [Cavenderia fasciculata]